MFSFSQTEPSTDLLNGSSWATTGEGSQNFQDFSDNGSSHSGEAEEYIFTSGQTTPRGTRLDQGRTRQDMPNAWNNKTVAAVPKGGQAMSRVNSNRSSGSSLSQTSQLSHVDVTGNTSAFRNGSPSGAIAGIDSCLLLESEAEAISSQMYWPGYPLDMALTTADAAFSMAEVSPLHVVPAHMQLGPDISLENSPPGSWDCFSSSVSRSSSPATIEDTWLSAPLSPHSSPEIQCQSPRYVLLETCDYEGASSYHSDSFSIDRKITISDDLNGKPLPQLDETLSLPPPFTAPRRQSNEGESARDHHLYKSATPMADGLYHCPWEGQATCNHKPEKLKCNYE